MLDEIDVAILRDLYEWDFNNGPRIRNETYELSESDGKSRVQEFVAHLLRLERLKFIKFEGQPIVFGGHRNPKYNNNAVSVMWSENIHIDDKGIDYLKELDKSDENDKNIGDTLIQGAKWFGKEISKALAKKIAAGIVTITAAFILYLIFGN